MATQLLVEAAPHPAAGCGTAGDLGGGVILALPILLVVVLLGRRRRRA
jgi:uncharacterized protein (TIGR03382 family)